MSGAGGTYKGIIRNQKREKPVGFFCGQRYYWTKVLRMGLLAGFSVLIFRNQNPACTIKKKKENSHLLALAPAQLATAYWLL